MPSLFIANTSNKHNEFNFRLPERSQLIMRTIPAGKQMEVLSNASKEDVDAVIKQHEPYGLVHFSQIKNACKLTGSLYSIDKPVTVDAMELAMEKNSDMLLEQGYELQKIAAVASNAQLSEAISHSIQPLGEQRSVEFDVQQIPEERTDKQKMLKTKIKVAKK
jgi:hypothetical protein